MSLIEAHKIRWDWKTILNLSLNVTLNEAHKETWREPLFQNTKSMIKKLVDEMIILVKLYFDRSSERKGLLFPWKKMLKSINNFVQKLAKCFHTRWKIQILHTIYEKLLRKKINRKINSDKPIRGKFKNDWDS